MVRPRKYARPRRIDIVMPSEVAEEIEEVKGKVSWGDFIIELWEFWKMYNDLVKGVYKMDDKEVYKSADVSIEQGKDKLVVEVFTGTKIVRIVAFRGYIEEVARREFGEPQPPMVAPPVPVITSTVDRDVTSTVDHDVSSSAQSAEVEEKASGEEKKEEKKEKKKKRKKRKGEKRAETLKERVRIFRIFNNILMKYPSGYKTKVMGQPGNPSPIPVNLALSWVRDITRKLELDTDDDIEVFEEEIKANLDKFDPVMKDLLKNLLESWRGYKVRKH